MNDKEVTDRFRVVAFDMPYHGRSTPPDQWWLKKPRLTTKLYVEIVRAVWTTLELVMDLQNRRYLALGLQNEEVRSYDFTIQRSVADYQPNALRARGTR